jgi:hypothetical protein
LFFLKSLTDLNPNQIINLILEESKILLKSKNVQSKIIAFLLIGGLNSFNDITEIFTNFMEDHGLIELLLQTFSKNKNFKLHTFLFYVFSPLIPKMIETGRYESIQFVSSHFWMVFEKDVRNFRDLMIPFVAKIIKTCDKLQFPLKIDRYEILNMLYQSIHSVKFFPLLFALFHESFHFDVSNIHVRKMIDLLLDMIDFYYHNEDFLNALKIIFRCIRLDARPWLTKTFEICVQCLENRNSHFENYLLLLLEMIQLFNEEMESLIFSSNLIDLIVPWIIVEFDFFKEKKYSGGYISEVVCFLLYEMCIYQSKGLEACIPNILIQLKENNYFM